MAWKNDNKRGFYLDKDAVLRETGLARNTQKDILYSWALAGPAEYNVVRRNVVKDVTHKLVQQLYNTVYAALLDGKREDNNKALVVFPDTVADKIGVARGTEYSPMMKEAEVSQVAYEVATSLIKLLDEKVCE